MEHRGQKREKDTKWNVNKNKNVQRETYKYESRRKLLYILKIRGPEEDNMNNGEQISKNIFQENFPGIKEDLNLRIEMAYHIPQKSWSRTVISLLNFRDKRLF